MDSGRKAAYLTLIAMDKDGGYSNLTLNKIINKERPDNPGFTRELVYGVLKNRIYIDNVIEHLVTSGVKKIRNRELNILRLGVYQILFLESVPDYAACDESVKLAKKFAYGKDKFVNAVLRNLLRNKEKDFLPEDSGSKEYLSIKYSVEPWILDLWLAQYDKDKVIRILEASTRTPELNIRVNRLKIDKSALKEKLTQLGFAVRDSKLAETCIICEGTGIIETELYREGMFSVQDEASQLAALSVDASPGENVLDMCAAPGGKTCAMAEGMANQGVIVALDLYEHRLELINKNLERLNIKNIKTKCKNSSKIERKYVDNFQKVLCDVPCSGFGVIRRKPEIKLKKQTNLMELYEIQRQIIDCGAQYVKVGGTLVYSTCTINQEENENQIRKFLAKHANFHCVWEKQYLPDVDGTDGFYIAKLVRKS